MRTLRQRFVLWSLTRFLHAVRRRLARDPSPLRVRRDMAAFDRRLGGLLKARRSPPVALQNCLGHWVEPQGEHDRVILYLHGGAFVAAAPNAHGLLLEKLCAAAGARGFYVDYRLAPEHAFPAASDDCLDAYRFLLDAGVPPGSIAIAGDSAGGNLTLGTALRVRDLGLPLPAALVMMSPVLDATFSGASVARNDGLDPLFRASVFEALASQYVPDRARRDRYVSPLFADLTGLPPSLVLVGSSELLLDDSVRFAQRAQAATLEVWHGMPHVFPAMHGLPEAEAAIRGMGEFLRRHVEPAVAANRGSSPQAR
jgi:epsilon-lactone hydrolase